MVGPTWFELLAMLVVSMLVATCYVTAGYVAVEIDALIEPARDLAGLPHPINQLRLWA